MDLYKRCRDQSVKFFTDSFRETLQKADELLSGYMDKAPGNVQRMRFLEAQTAIRDNAKPFVEGFRVELHNAFERYYAGLDEEEQAEDEQPEGLELVDQDRFEDEIAVNMMISRANASNAESLWKLNKRLAVVRGGKKLNDQANPCGPFQLSHSVKKAIEPFDLPTPVKIILYKIYDKHTLVRAGKFYDKMNDQLAAEGVLENLTFEVVKEAGSDYPGQDVPGAAEAEAEEAAAGMPPQGPDGTSEADLVASIIPLITREVQLRQSQLLDAIRTLQSRRASTGPRRATAVGVDYGRIQTDGTLGSPDTFSREDLATALSSVQQSLQVPDTLESVPNKVEDNESQLVAQLETLGNQTDQQKVTNTDADTIDLVGMLFNYMLDDSQVPDSVKSLLSHLHTPYLKVALVDKAFFAKANHPARQLLDLMAASGARWIQDEDSDQQVFERMRGIVERVVNEFEEDLALFDDLLNDFTRFIRLLEKRADLAEKRHKETEKGLEQLATAKNLADDVVRARLENSNLPAPIMELLEKPWTDFLVFNYLRHGKESKAWESALKVVEGVIRSLQPDQGADLDQVKKQHEKLNNSVEEGLANIGYNSEEAERLIEALNEAQGLALQGLKPVLDEQKYQPRTEEGRRGSAIERQLEQQRSRDDGEEKLDISALSADERALMDKLSRIEFGTWFEFRRASDSRVQRLKLAWYSSVSGNYMFVNHSGVKCAVKPLYALVRGITEGSITMVDKENRNFIERALTSVLGRLKI